MTFQTIDTDTIVAQTLALLNHYCFELPGTTAIDLLASWLEKYQADWVRLAVIEALYRGRYKAVSVEQILNLWSRRQYASYGFNHEFERLICRKLPRNLTHLSEQMIQARQLPVTNPLQEEDIPIQEQQTSQDYPDSPHWQEWDESTDYLVSWIKENRQGENLGIESQLTSEIDTIAEATSSDDLAFDSPPVTPTSQPKPNPYQANWSRVEAGQHPIGQFTPSIGESRFYQKLKAVSQIDKG